MLARPSTPRPQTPTVASASADQEIGWRIALRDVVRRPVGASSVAASGAAPPAVPVRPRSRRRWRCRLSARSSRAAASSTAARHSSTSPTHSNGLGVGAQPEQGSRTAPRWPGSRAARSPRRSRPRSARVHERRQDQVDEAALVAAPAPVVEPRGPGPGGRRGYSCGRRGGSRVSSRELLGHPQLGARAEIARTPTARARARARTSSPKRLLELVALGPLVVDGARRRPPASAPRPTTRWRAPPRRGRSSAAATTAAAVMMAVTGTCPFRNPSSSERRTRGSISRATWMTGSPVTRGRVLDRGEAVSGWVRRRTARRPGGRPPARPPSRWSRCRRRRGSAAVPARGRSGDRRRGRSRRVRSPAAPRRSRPLR